MSGGCGFVKFQRPTHLSITGETDRSPVGHARDSADLIEKLIVKWSIENEPFHQSRGRKVRGIERIGIGLDLFAIAEAVGIRIRIKGIGSQGV